MVKIKIQQKYREHIRNNFVYIENAQNYCHINIDKRFNSDWICALRPPIYYGHIIRVSSFVPFSRFLSETLLYSDGIFLTFNVTINCMYAYLFFFYFQIISLSVLYHMR